MAKRIQIWYNKIRDRLDAQGCGGASSDGACFYYGEGKLQCAIGLLVGRKVGYELEMQGDGEVGSWTRQSWFLFKEAVGAKQVSEAEQHFLEDCQKIHDCEKGILDNMNWASIEKTYGVSRTKTKGASK